jgi:hypothetical protein
MRSINPYECIARTLSVNKHCRIVSYDYRTTHIMDTYLTSLVRTLKLDARSRDGDNYAQEGHNVLVLQVQLRRRWIRPYYFSAAQRSNRGLPSLSSLTFDVMAWLVGYIHRYGNDIMIRNAIFVWTQQAFPLLYVCMYTQHWKYNNIL